MDPIALAQAGPVAILLFFITAIVAGFIGRKIVPGWLYDQEREQRIKAEAENAELIKALLGVSKVAADGGRKPAAGASRRG